MALTADAQERVARAMMAHWDGDADESCAFSRQELAAAVAAMDALLDANRGAINAALPVGFRTKATLAQKGLLLAYTAIKQAGLTLRREDP